jgi:hypothetical protein
MVSHDLLPAKSGVFLDATYVPLYIQTLIWLATQPAFRPAVPWYCYLRQTDP